ncbi:PH domain-containing protein [Paraglaciecola sp.]|uniref:PH domain-containing protein n=1 Tax=Paraglaciecola sp. TaxID=1920173 RepID=UPI0030F40294
MTYIEESLSKDEKVHEIFNLHWFAKIAMVIWIILAITALGIILIGGSDVGIGVLAIPTFGITLILAIWEWLKLRSLEQGVTNKRVIRKTGIISRKTDEMKISSIETVEINQGIVGRIFGFGNVKITGRGISDVVFVKIDDPLKVKKSIESVDAI